MTQDTVLLLAVMCVILPITAFAIQMFFNKRLPRNGDWVSLGAIFICLFLAICIFFHVTGQNNPDLKYELPIKWMFIGLLNIPLGLVVDNLTAIMLMVVTIVSSFVHLYSVGYMKGENRYGQYFGFLSLFSFSMLMLILADNLLLLYISWELVGISSYLLIGFYFEKNSAAYACKKAFLTNRVGDIGMFLGILIFYTQLGTFRLSEIFSAINNGEITGGLFTLAGVLLFMGAVGKSAQFPLHIWLPDAMEGPTPVSALIHAATMVAAGVYMIGRCFPMFSPDALLVIAYSGAFTAFMSATIATTQTDIKRVLAYSTVSQLGFMVAGLGCGSFYAGLYHLTTHAMFKACLFLCSGSVIHAVHSQEIFDMGGLRKKMPITFWTFLISTCSLAGFPWIFTGFWSKEAILTQALGFVIEHPQHFLLFLLPLISAGLTAFYMFRLTFITFFGKPRDHHKFEHAHESPKVMTVPLIVLAVLSIAWWNTAFYNFQKHVVVADPQKYSSELPGSMVNRILGNAQENVHQDVAPSHDIENENLVKVEEHTIEAHGTHGVSNLHIVSHEAHEKAHYPTLFLSIIVAFSGIYVAYLMYFKGSINPVALGQKHRNIYLFLKNKWYIDELVELLVIHPTIIISKLMGFFDLKVIDWIVNASARGTRDVSFGTGKGDLKIVDGAVNGVAFITLLWGAIIRRIETGRLQHYFIGIIAGTIIILLIRIF